MQTGTLNKVPGIPIDKLSAIEEEVSDPRITIESFSKFLKVPLKKEENLQV
jgi:hypothetical protein